MLQCFTYIGQIFKVGVYRKMDETIGCAPHEGGVNRKRKLLKKRGYIRYIRYFTLITIGYEDTVGKTKDTLDTLLHYQ